MTETVRVLHVDDDPAFVELVATHLERRGGFEVVAETDPCAVLDRLEGAEGDGDENGSDGRPAAVDCVVSDYEMGGTTGIDLLRCVRERHERLPFVLLTSRGSEEVASEAISAGVTDYIQKRTHGKQYELLANRIRNAVEHYRTERRLRESEALYRTVVERTHDAIYIYQGDRFRFVNRRVRELTGYEESELREKEIWALLHPDDEARVRRIAERRASAGEDATSRYTARVVRKDGETVRCTFDVQRIRYEGEPATLGTVREVSDEERAEERFQALIERSTDLVTTVDREGVIRYQSPSSERILGIDPKDAVGREVRSFVHPEDETRVRATFERLSESAGSAVETLRFRIRHADGSWVWLESVARADPVESIDGIVVNSRDVTERLEYEQRLRRYESLVQNIRQGACIVGTDRRLSFVNRVVEAWTDVPVEELVGRPVSALRDVGILDDEGFRRVAASVDRILTGEGEYERHRLPANLPSDVERIEADLSPLHEQGPDGPEGAEAEATRGVVVVLTDVTAQSRYQERLSALHSANRELTTATTYDDVARVVSDAAENILGYPLAGVAFYDADRDALVTRALSDAAAETVRDQVIPHGEGIAWRVLESGEGEVLNNVGEDPDALNPDTEVQNEVIFPIGEEGVLIAGSWEADNLGDSRVSLTRLLALNASAALERVQREQLLRRRERELESQNEQLEQVASVVSHDLRNPLNLASGQVELLRANYTAGDDDAVMERLERIEGAHRRMRRIIEDMLDLARNGQPVEELETVLLGSVVRDAWETAMAGSDATLEVPDELGTIEAHEGRVRQLFENLFRNAVEHAETDGSAESGDGTIAVRVGRLDDGGFFVEDDGDGIPEADRETVFDPGVSSNPEGTGLGLGIVRTIAHAHGWSVTAVDGRSGGARFDIRTDGSENDGVSDRERSLSG
ncbi:PAS domain S-box [Halogeometricum pallidum JCM 14848]|uniref:histidine kinase n=1 Tax=Halogeometricum pallidum JCM 14848 TaxID=1227487 RepID=M0DBI5_HALPD|nr:PAS domain S-box protein [Halogeometricum pallidum]ELZ31519.1 PAS domain S-box [Halogeometricum pallidum JCM 14848]